jgi:hypothetical protein
MIRVLSNSPYIHLVIDTRAFDIDAKKSGPVARDSKKKLNLYLQNYFKSDTCALSKAAVDI